jgi:electron transfer flavoprotein alpha subunit
VIAVVPVRGGTLVAGGEEAIAEAGGVGIVVGDGAAAAAAAIAARAATNGSESQCRELMVLELRALGPARCAVALAPHVNESRVVVLPASPDGRDIAPRLAAVLGWPLLAGALKVTAGGAWVARLQGRQIAHCVVEGPFVATLLPGSRSALVAGDTGGASSNGASVVAGRSAVSATAGAPESSAPEAARVRNATVVTELETPAGSDVADAELLEVMEADPAVMDLVEASRILAAGAGIGGPEHLAQLQLVAAKLGASVGATRVVTDAGWLGHDRQIGTTGVSVRPRCYVAFGVSGAAQHVGGLGAPKHIISVNLDRSCPMMAMADLALVSDAREVLDVLARRLSPEPAPASASEPAPASASEPAPASASEPAPASAPEPAPASAPEPAPASAPEPAGA